MKKNCPVCETEILRKSKQWAKQIYCSTKCRKIAHRKKTAQFTRTEKKRANMLQNDEVLYLVRQCRRAKTVQILYGHTSQSFIETMEIVRLKPKLDVNICHISPVKGKNSTGLFHAENLFYGGAHQNKKLGNKQLGRGLSIKNKELLAQWAVSEEHSTNEILLKIEEYLGDIISEYIAKSPIRKSKKAQIARKIIEVEPRRDFDKLMALSHTELLRKWSTLSNTTSRYTFTTKRESKYIVYIDEISRFISYNRDDTRELKKLRKAMIIGYIALERVCDSQTYNKDFTSKYKKAAAKHHKARLINEDSWSEFKDLIYDTAFDALQGKRRNIHRIYRKILSHIEYHTEPALD